MSLLFIVAIALPEDAGARQGRHPLVTGVSYLLESDPPAFRRVRAAGARMVQTIARWGQIAPRGEPATWNPEDPADPHYDWGLLDAWVTNAVAAGLTPVLDVASAPRWAQGCEADGVRPLVVCDPDPPALAAFTVAAARRYSGRFAGLPRVRYWQGLNEPNLSLFFNPQFGGDGKPVSPERYRRLINAFYAAVKSVDRSNLVLAAGLGPIARPGYTVGPMRFARQLLCMRGRRQPRPAKGNCGGGVRFDIFDVHPYTTGGPTHRGHADDVEIADLPKLQRLLRAADRAGRIKGAFRRTPLWVTEFSWDSNPPDPGGLSMPILARWTAEALHTAWRAGVSRFFWYSLRDQAVNPSRPFSETLESGLYFRGATLAEDRPKRVLYAFRFPFVAHSRRGGIAFWGRTPDGRRGRVAIQARRGGRWRTIAVARAAGTGIFRGVARTGYGRGRRGTVRARCRGQTAIPFSLRPVPDFRQPPFG
jgi:hypothetical protein